MQLQAICVYFYTLKSPPNKNYLENLRNVCKNIVYQW